MTQPVILSGNPIVSGSSPVGDGHQVAPSGSTPMGGASPEWPLPQQAALDGIAGTIAANQTLYSNMRSLLTFATPATPVDGSGGLDCSAAFVAAIAALSGTGTDLLIPNNAAGNAVYKLNAQIQWIAGKPLTIRVAPGVTVLANFVGDSTPAGGSLFLAPALVPVVTTTVAAINTPGTATISMTVAPTVGQYIHPVATAAIFQQGLYKVVKVTGVGPYTVTVDRPILYQFAAADAVKTYADVNRGLHFVGNGCRFTGTTVRYFEMVQCWDSTIEGILCDAGSGAPTDMFASFDVGSYRCRFIDCHADAMLANGTPATLTSCAWALESAEASGFERCSALNMNAYGYLFDDTRGCWALDCRASNCSFGAAVTGDGNTIGCDDTKILGGNFDANVSDGIAILNGSSHTVAVGFSANYNGGYGVSTTTGANASSLGNFEARGNGNAGVIVASGTTDTKIANGDVSGSGKTGTNAALVAAGDLDANGITIVDTVGAGGSNRILVTAGRVGLRGVNLQNNQNTALNVVALQGGTVDISGQLLVGHGSNALAVGGATVDASNLKIGFASSSSAEIGFYISAGTLRLGYGCDSSTCATPFLLSGGTMEVAQINGIYAISTTGGAPSVALTPAQGQRTDIETTGALASNAAASVPAVPGMKWLLRNNNTGAFTTGLKITSTVNVAQGKAAWIRVNSAGDVERASLDA